MLIAAAFVSAAAVPPQTVTRLERGEIIVEMRQRTHGNTSMAVSMGIIAAPVDQVWNLIVDYGQYERLYTGIPRSDVRSRLGSKATVYLEIDLPWPLPDRWCILEFQADEPRKLLTWKRISGTFRKYEGRAKLSVWTVNRTFLQVEAGFDPGYDFLPGWLLDYFIENSVPGVVSGPRDHLQRLPSRG